MPPPRSHSSWVSDWLREPSTTSLVSQLLGSIVSGYESPVPPPCSHSSWVLVIAGQYHLPVHTAPGFYSDLVLEPSTTSLFTQLLGSCDCRPVPPPCSHSSWVSGWLREAQYHLPGHTAPGFYSDRVIEPNTISLFTQLLGSCDCSPVPPPCSHRSWVSDWLREPSTTSLVAQLLDSIVTGYESPVPPPCSHSSWGL